jgi:hypothetical protein
MKCYFGLTRHAADGARDVACAAADASRYADAQNMEQRINLASLKGIGILYKNDLHSLGQFVLKAYDAQWVGSSSKARPTLYGLARIYGLILDRASKPLEEAIEAHGLPLGATVVDGPHTVRRRHAARRRRADSRES